ncbi:MAG: ammonia-forming cytochrome c nitrite reductase subunit c552 [Coriobacteriia bacterium]|nr:ammonia-forming cytochrome c nitrite reductase subunit c552 [Coriobacteriia bacterium]
MRKEGKKFKAVRWIAVACICALVLTMVACSGNGSSNTSSTGTTDTTTPQTGTYTQGQPTGAQDAAGVYTADAWKDAYPNQYNTYRMGAEINNSSTRQDMTVLYPAIKTIWIGSAFSKYYNQPNDHQYALEDVRATGRVNDTTAANCLTCKSPDFTAMYQSEGDTIFAKPFADVSAQLTEPISCYNCHENQPMNSDGTANLVVTQKFFLDSLGADASKVPLASQVCGQCHNEYYFAPGTKAVTNPWTSLANATPDAMYDYYKTAGPDGTPFVDYTNPNTGVQQLKVQHPEFEWMYGGKGVTMTTTNGYTCADCHMGQPQVASDGTGYTSHTLQSPLQNTELLKTCNQGGGCHTDIASQVQQWQSDYQAAVKTSGDKLVDLNLKLTDAVANNTLDDATLATIRDLNRQAQWYYDFIMVENSNGAHNPDLVDATLSKCDMLTDQALNMF